MIDRKNEYVKMAAVEDQLWWYKALHTFVYNQISKTFTEKSITIIDAGCGTGGLLKFLGKKKYTNIEGFDVSIDAVDICKSAQLNVYLDSISNISNHYKAQSVDVIISNDTFYFFSEIERRKLINSFFDLLNSNGLVIMNLPSLKAFRGIHDISVGVNYRFSKNDILKMVDTSKFKIVKATYWPFFLSPIIFFSRLMQRVKLKINKNSKIESDIDLPARIINGLLFKVTNLENNILNCKPFGSSLFLVLEKIN